MEENKDKPELTMSEVANNTGVDAKIMLAAVVQVVLNLTGGAIAVPMEKVLEVVKEGEIDFQIVCLGDGLLKLISPLAIQRNRVTIPQKPEKLVVN